MTPPPFDTEELLAQLGWVRALARRVAPDLDVADDLTQEALLVALDRGGVRGGARPGSLRRWLAVVVRNLGRTSRRSERRRAERESRVAERELPPSAFELIERAATQRELVGHLLELDEPYRSTLLMRFFEECSQREIAERTGVPVSTVGTRVAEGLKRLRRKCGGRERWFSSVFAFLRRPEALARPAFLTGVALVSIKTKVIVGGVVLAGALLAFQRMAPGPSVAFEPEPTVEEPRQDLARVDAPIEAARQAVEAEEPAEEQALDFHDIPEHAGVVHVMARVRGRVIELDGTPVGEVEVCRVRPGGFVVGEHESAPTRVLAQNTGCVTADAAGRFEIEGAVPYLLGVRDEHYVTLFEGLAAMRPDLGSNGGSNDEAEQGVLVVVAPRIPLAGVVVDDLGAPLEGVRITLQPIVSRAGLDLSGSNLVIPEAKSDAHGAFEITNAPGVEEGQVQFQKPGFVTRILPVPAGGDAALRVVMSRAAESPYTIRGHVVLADGSPAVGAHVSTGVMATPTDERGFFVLDFEPWLEFRVDPEAPTVLTAILPGLLPATRTLPSVNQARESGWPDDIVLVLDGEPLTIRGIVVDEEGQPVQGVLVEPVDMTDFGFVPAEDKPAFFGVPRTQEQLAGGGVAHTGADGRFELSGLLDRSYSLSALSRPSLLYTVTEPVRAGDRNVRIVLDRGVLGTIAGRIVDRHGEGIGGVRVSVSRGRTGELVIGASAVTDDDGRFRITEVTTAPAFLRIEGDAIVPELFRELADDADVTALELPVGRRCRIQFDWGVWPGRQDELVVVDEHDERLMMMRLRGNSIGEMPSVSFQEQPTGVLVVSDAAAYAVIYREGEEVTRIALDLSAVELNLIEL